VEAGGLRARVHAATAGERPPCEKWGALGWSKGRVETELVDLACLGIRTRLVWHKRRWVCRMAAGCGSNTNPGSPGFDR